MRLSTLTATLGLCVGLLLATPGCDSNNDPGASYSVAISGEAFTGGAVSCKLNTSAPAGDANRGKFFVSIDDFENRFFSVLVQFRALESAPPAGDYAVGADVSLQGSYDDPDDGRVGGGISSGTVQVTDEAPGFRLTFNGTEFLTGSIYCPNR